MWQLELAQSWINTLPQFLSRDAEISMIIANVRRYKALLSAGMPPNEPDQEYLRKLPSSIIAVNQAGLSPEPGELQAYTFAYEVKRVLWLLGIGKVTSENADMEYYKALVYTLVNMER